MSDKDSQMKYPIVPSSELRCVWMTAGVLSYQLCERQFECEQCPLDVALRQRFMTREAALGHRKTVVPVAESEGPPGDAYYGRKHVWVRSEGGRRVRMGVEPGFASALLSPKAIVLPAIGERIVRNKVCAWIVLDGGTLPLVSPVSGEVHAANTHLTENPHAVCLSPLGQGWLFEVVVDGDLAADADLFTIADVARVYADDERKFQALLTAELARVAGTVGLTLADGGQPLDSISQMLGPAKYFKLVRNIYT